MNSLNRDQWKEVDEALDTLIDDDYWSYPEDTRSMIFTTKKIKDLFHSELEKVRQEAEDNMRKRCLEALPKKDTTNDSKRNDNVGVGIRAWNLAINQATQNINNLDKE